MVLSKALKAKLFLILSGVASLSTLGLEQRIVGPLFNHLAWQRSRAREARYRALSMVGTVRMCNGFCSSLSLFILRFTLVELFKQNNKINSGKIYRHKFM